MKKQVKAFVSMLLLAVTLAAFLPQVMDTPTEPDPSSSGYTPEISLYGTGLPQWEDD